MKFNSMKLISDKQYSDSRSPPLSLDLNSNDALEFFRDRFVQVFSRSIEATLRGTKAVGLCMVGRNLKGKEIGYRMACMSALIYVVVALGWALADNNVKPLTLANALVIGAIIAPGLAPWLRLFPIAGDPMFNGWRRLVDLLVNAVVHTVSSSLFVFTIKCLVALVALPLLGELSWPSFFKGSVGLVLAGYGRRFATEMIGIHALVPHHRLTPELLVESGVNTTESVAHQKLRVWNELREMPGPGFFGLASKRGRERQWQEGYRPCIDQSKALDPAIGGLIDHILS